MSIHYSDDFKRDAVEMVESGMTQRQVCETLGISKAALYTWVRDARALREGRSLPLSKEESRELSQAYKRINELEMEVRVLRKAAAYLSQQHITPPK